MDESDEVVMCTGMRKKMVWGDVADSIFGRSNTKEAIHHFGLMEKLTSTENDERSGGTSNRLLMKVWRVTLDFMSFGSSKTWSFL